MKIRAYRPSRRSPNSGRNCARWSKASPVRREAARHHLLEPRRADLRQLLLYVAGEAGPLTATPYIDRIERFCPGLDVFPERGRRLPAAARLMAFETSATIRIRVHAEVVRILRVAYPGRDLTKELA